MRSLLAGYAARRANRMMVAVFQPNICIAILQRCKGIKMKITRVEAIPFSIPMKRIEVFATGVISSLDHVLVKIWSDDGLVGIAEAPPRPTIYGDSVASTMAAIQDWFAPALLGMDPLEQDRVWHKLDKFEHNPTAKAAVDIALHDLIAKAAGLPLHRYLGGWTDSVTLSYVIGQGTAEETADQIETIRDTYGITWFKLKVGLGFRQDLGMIETVRRRVGDSISFYVDANHSYDAIAAAKAMRSWEGYDVAWVEEPSPASDFRGREMIAQTCALPMMADESCKTLASVTSEVARGHCRMISLKTGGTGYRLSKKILGLCEAFGVIAVNGSQSDSDVGAIAGAHFNAAHRLLSAMPAELCSFLDAAGGLLTEPIVVSGGRFSLGDGAGVGVEIDEDKLSHYRID